jgi:hypothetical protein
MMQSITSAVEKTKPRDIYSLGVFTTAMFLIAIPRPAHAHFFVQSYALPIPFWMYAWTAAAALFLSFIAAVAFASVPSVKTNFLNPQLADEKQKSVSYSASAGSYVALGLLVLCIVSGFMGPARSVDNFNMTFF